MAEMEEVYNVKDIFPLIDEVISKRDRYVNLFIGEHGISASIYPYEPGRRKWIRVNSHRVKCPECGATTDIQTPCCPMCGEQLAVSDPICQE